MKNNLLTLLASAAVFLATLWAREIWPAVSSAHGRYYMAVLLTISTIVCLITALRLIGLLHTRSQTTAEVEEHLPELPRQHYRLQFEQSPPQFVQKIDDHQSAAAFSCPVCDVSETGISLYCTGIFDRGQAVQGDIIFQSGRTVPINGMVIRNEPHRTCLHLHCMIDPPLLMAEQREQIANSKADGPRPVVVEGLLSTPAKSLPSHAPKGICRLKKP